MVLMMGSLAAAIALLVLFSLALIFSLVVLLGFVPTGMLWGRRSRDEHERSTGAVVSMAVLLILVRIELMRVGVLGRQFQPFGRWNM